MCLFNMQEYGDAILAMRKALKIDPYNHSTHYYLGLSLMAVDKYESAISSFTQSLLLDPDTVTPILIWGNLIMKQKKLFRPGKLLTVL